MRLSVCRVVAQGAPESFETHCACRPILRGVEDTINQLAGTADVNVHTVPLLAQHGTQISRAVLVAEMELNPVLQ